MLLNKLAPAEVYEGTVTSYAKLLGGMGELWWNPTFGTCGWENRDRQGAGRDSAFSKKLLSCVEEIKANY